MGTGTASKAELFASVRFRTAAAYVLLIVAAFTALGFYLVQRVEDDFRDSAHADLHSETTLVRNLIAPMLQRGASATDLDALVKQLAADTHSRLTIIAPDGTVLADSHADPATMENHLRRPEVQQALRSSQGISVRRSATLGEDLTYQAIVVGTSDGNAIVRVALPTAAIESTVSSLRRALLVALAVSAAVALLLGLGIGGSVVGPLRRLAGVAESMAAGDLTRRMSPRPSGELGQLADAFNRMAGSLETTLGASSEERSRLDAALNSSTDGIIAVDSEMRIAFTNRAASQALRGAQDMVGERLPALLPEAEVIEALERSLRDRERGSFTLERAGGRHLQITTTSILGGGEWRALVVLHDMTDVRRAEQTRRDFVANVSHELRTPLAAIKAVMETLASGALEDPKLARDFVRQAESEVDRVVQMVEELLELSRIESGQAPMASEPVDMAVVAERAVNRMQTQAERKSQALTLTAEPGLPAIVGDAARLEQALVNLVHNAIKFTGEGGSIDVSVRRENRAVTVSVSDTGVGIPASEVPRVFERFYKVDRARGERGTGLGLAVVKHTVEAHGGSVSVESVPGKGSTFRFAIPVADVS